jgi:type 1 glutamine amidotransferase
LKKKGKNMRRWTKWPSVWVITVLCLAPVKALPAPPIKTLIVDGQNNHTWESTTPVIKTILEQTELFTVDVATSPPKGQSLEAFKPEFAKYDVVVSNYNGGDWPKETQDAFVEYVRAGGGVVIIHAADNAFAKWRQYNEIIGLGGWGGRNESSGPYVYWKDGKFVRDDSPGRGGTHGKQHAFQVINRDKEHPITAGLPAKWMHAKDEMYSLMRGPAKRLTVLSTAYHDPAQSGSGRHEPILFIVRYGKGRVFHTVLGHNAQAMGCVGFTVTLQRGAEWAATEKVTQKVPEDFPTDTEVRIWKNHRQPINLDELLKDSVRSGPPPDGAVRLIGDDLSAWRRKTGDWQTVGAASMDPESPKRLISKSGDGIIVNGSKGKAVDIFSKAEFADMLAHIEFMVPQGSNSGVYFMGRYEVQILDSWGVTELKHGDCGGIYQRWDENRQPKGYEGHPPRVNASLPPGRWQRFDVVFRAPRFGADGGKTANACFKKVIHNGIVIHESVEVTGSTRAAAYRDEKPKGPLMLQGDHGPVAYRNIWILPLD